MATTLSDLQTMMKAMGYACRIDAEHEILLTGFATYHYINREGEHHLPVVIALLEKGEYLSFFTPSTYICPPDHPHLQAVLETAVRTQWSHRLIVWEYDHRDGELRGCVRLPLEDTPLTHLLFHRCLHGLVGFVDRSYEEFTHALNTGTCLDPEMAESLRRTQCLATPRRPPGPAQPAATPTANEPGLVE